MDQFYDGGWHANLPNDGSMVDGLRCYQNYERLLEEDIDILIVCLTNDVAEVTIAGLECGLHVFCEKPPGRNVADIVRVIEIEKEASKTKIDVWI